MKAIETSYSGYRFRSRMEARWAVFLDAIGANWEYESEGYSLDNGNNYLPDFLVHGVDGLRGIDVLDIGTDLYIEVKGVMNDKDAKKINLFSKSKPILVVGGIPYTDGDIYDFAAEVEDEMDADIAQHPEWPARHSSATINGYGFPVFLAVDECGNIHLISQCYCDFADIDIERTISAYRVARGSRFEYGETGGHR